MELGDRTYAQDVNDRESEQPEPKPAAATPRFGRFHGDGLALVCGGLGHGENVKQWQGVLQKETK
jgi:hypothetical protein